MRLSLPSGASVELDDSAPEIAPPRGIFEHELSGIRARFTRELGELPLADLHTLRAVLRKTGAIDEAPIPIVCQNCDHEFEVTPSATFELGPYLDGELGDPELDAPFEFDRDWEIEPADPHFSRVRLRDVTVAEASPLHVALAGGFRITSKVVRAMGIVSLGDEMVPVRIARRLSEASDELFDRIAAVFEDAHYPPRLVAPHPCPECKMVEWVPIPAERELTVAAADGHRHVRHGAEPFIDEDAFEARVREAADRIYRELGVANIDLAVMDGPADCDDAGEPLLGCYLPPDPEGLIPRPAEVKLFYRTFAAIWQDEGPYDVEAEIDETLRHELEHHLGHLAGDDPMDDEERRAIDRELTRRVGRKETERRAVRAFGSELGDFFRRTWLVWVIAAALTLLAVLADR